MTISLKHKFTSLKGDGSDATLLRPSNWNDEHNLLCAQDTIIGRASAGSGAVEEITCTAVARSILDDTTIAAILETLGVSPPTTGDIRLTLKTTATTGWVMFNDGTIGNTGSGATRANADTQALFVLLYDNLNDTWAPVSTSAGAATTRAAQGSAATAFAANCRLSLPRMLGRAIAISGSGASLTARTLGQFLGVETATLLTANLPPYTPSGSITNGAISINNQGGAVITQGPASGWGISGSSNFQTSTGLVLSASQAASTFNGAAQGGTSAPFGIMQPTTFLNAMVKL